MFDDAFWFGDDVVVGIDGNSVIDHDEVLLVANVKLFCV